MSIFNFLKDVAAKLFDGDFFIKKYNYDQILKIINKFPEPRNDFERAKFQYVCTMKRNIFFVRFISNAISLFIYPIYLKRLKKNYKRINFIEKYDAVFFTNRNSLKIVPDLLKERYKSIKISSYHGLWGISEECYKFLKNKVFKTCRSPYFRLKCLIKFSMYASVIKMYNPKAIIGFTESSFTTSLLTNFCESMSVRNIYVMHGERTFCLKFPFLRCNEYYAWDSFYIDQFYKMRCLFNESFISIPDEIKMTDFNSSASKEFDFTFYLQDENKRSLKLYNKIFAQLRKKNYKLCVRPHPRFADLTFKYLKDNEICIEDFNDITLGKSLSRTKNAVSKFSTVLYQAYLKKVPIVIDDITNYKKYKFLCGIKYFMLNKPHILLTEVIKDDKNN